MTLTQKIKEARRLLGLTQADAATQSGLSQRDISEIENGVKKFISVIYIQFLYKRGIDLNSLFEEKTDTVTFRDEESDKMAGKIAAKVAGKESSSGEETGDLAAIVAKLSKEVKTLNERIDNMQESLQTGQEGVKQGGKRK